MPMYYLVIYACVCNCINHYQLYLTAIHRSAILHVINYQLTWAGLRTCPSRHEIYCAQLFIFCYSLVFCWIIKYMCKSIRALCVGLLSVNSAWRDWQWYRFGQIGFLNRNKTLGVGGKLQKYNPQQCWDISQYWCISNMDIREMSHFTWIHLSIVSTMIKIIRSCMGPVVHKANN